METPPEPLADLIARAKGGDEAALGELLRRHEPRLRLAARRLLGPLLRPHVDSLDLVQSVHRALLPGLRDGRFDLGDPDQIMAIALTAVRRKAADRCRRARRQSELGEAAAGRLVSGRADDDPERVAAARDAVARLLAELDGLDRQVVELRLAGCETPEVAERLGVDAHVLRARLSRLRAKLRAAGADGWV